jgi:hypothetical protein
MVTSSTSVPILLELFAQSSPALVAARRMKVRHNLRASSSSAPSDALLHSHDILLHLLDLRNCARSAVHDRHIIASRSTSLCHISSGGSWMPSVAQRFRHFVHAVRPSRMAVGPPALLPVSTLQLMTHQQIELISAAQFTSASSATESYLRWR